MKKKNIIIAVVACSVLLIAAYFFIQNRISKNITEDIDNFISQTSDFADITYSTASVNLLKTNAIIKDVQIVLKNEHKQNIQVEKIIIHNVDKNSKIPHFMKISLNGIQFDNVNHNNVALNFFCSLCEQNHVDVHFDYKLSPTKCELALLKKDNILVSKTNEAQIQFYDLFLKDVSIHVHQLGSLNFLLDVEQIIINDFDDILQFLAIKRAKLTYTDKGLISDIFDSIAEIEGVDKKYVIEIITTAINNFADYVDNDRLNRVCDKINQFIENPHIISISMTPENAVLYSQLITELSNEEFIDALHLKIKVK